MWRSSSLQISLVLFLSLSLSPSISVSQSPSVLKTAVEVSQGYCSFSWYFTAPPLIVIPNKEYAKIRYNFILNISYRVTGLYRLGKTCYLHSLLCNNSIITQFSVQ